MTAPSKTASEPLTQAQPLTQAESFEFLKSLNKAKKLVIKNFSFGGYKDLKPEGCFGVRLANGRGLVGESSGNNTYGLRGYKPDQDGKNHAFVFVGLLFAEFPFSIQNGEYARGPYLAMAYQDALELHGGVAHELRLKVPFPEALLAEKATEIPRFSLAVEKGAIVLTLHGNTWELVPR